MPSINDKSTKEIHNALIPVGELLVQAELVSEAEISEALLHVRQKGLPIGKVLVMLGYLKQKDILNAIEAQSLINDDLLHADIAAKALNLAAKNNLKLLDALQQLGWHQAEGHARNRLGELLLASHVITKNDLQNSLNTSMETGLPLGKVLVFQKHISSEFLSCALSGQKLMREGLIGREQLIKGLSAIAKRQSTIEESMVQWGFPKLPGKRSNALGDLLLQSGLLKDNQLLTAMEISLSEEKPVGEVFIEQRFISRSILKAALKLQEMIDNGTLTSALAAVALQEIQKNGSSVAKATAKVGLPKLNVEEIILLKELLTLAGIVDSEEMTSIDDRENSSNFPQLLLTSGLVDESFLDAAFRCIYLIEQKFFEQEDAIMALHYCQTNNISIDDALKELAWTVATRRRL